MKKFFFFLFVFSAVLLGIYGKEQILWCTRLFSNEPTMHTIQKGEYLSKLSKDYYGTTEYWRELALVNRAPDADLVFPGEEIVVPSLEAVEKIKSSRSLSNVNTIVDQQKRWIAEHITEPATKLADRIEHRINGSEESAVETQPDESPAVITEEADQPVSEEKAPEKSSGNAFLLIILASVLVISGAVLLFMRKQKKTYSIEKEEVHHKQSRAPMFERNNNRRFEEEEEVEEYEKKKENALV